MQKFEATIKKVTIIETHNEHIEHNLNIETFENHGEPILIHREKVTHKVAQDSDLVGVSCQQLEKF